MPIDTSILGGITLPQLRDPQQEAINQLNMRSMQLNQQKIAMDMRQQEQKDKDLSLLDQIMSQLPKDASGYIDPDKAQELVPGRLRPIVANAVKEINEAKANVEQTKKKLVQDLAEGVYQARFDPQAQSQMFLGKLAAMRDANLVSDADAKDMLRLVTRPSAPGADPNTGGINTDALNAVVAGLMGSERMKAIQNAEGQNRIVVGKSLVDRNTGKVIFAEPEEPKPAPQPTQASIEADVMAAQQRIDQGQAEPGDQSKVNAFRSLQNMKRPPQAGPAPETPKKVTSGDSGRIADLTLAVRMADGLSFGDSGFVVGQVADLNPAIKNILSKYGGEGGEKLVSKANARRAQIELTKVILAKSIEKGVLTDEDLKRYAFMIPSLDESESTAKEKLNFVQNFAKNRRQDFLSALEDSGYDVSKHQQRISSEAPNPFTTTITPNLVVPAGWRQK